MMNRIFAGAIVSLVFSLYGYENIYANDNELLNEYKLLYTDLINLDTAGYKSFYNSEINKAELNINFSQGAIQNTENRFNCAILGDGFFKIRLENDLAGYTRAGEFFFNSEGELVTKDGYSFYGPLFLGIHSMSVEIHEDHSIYINPPDGTKELTGKLLTYKIPPDMLRHYKDAVYILKDDREINEELTFENRILHKFLELSNYDVLPVLLRMYYIVSIASRERDGLIANSEFKKELIKLQLEKMAGINNAIGRSFRSIDATIKKLLHILNTIGTNENREGNQDAEPFLKSKPDEARGIIKNIEEIRTAIYGNWLDENFRYLKGIIPFIKYDY
jgi:flagellar basal body rod protein FlgF